MPRFAENVLMICVILVAAHCIKMPCDKQGRPILDQLEDVEGIHNLDICQIYPQKLHLPTDQPYRACTAALIMVNGQAMALTAATCFLSNNPSAIGGHFSETSKGFSFRGKVDLTCGPDLEKLEIESNERNEKVLLHPKFQHKELQFIHQNNLAVIRVDKEDYDRIKQKENWLFTRMSTGETLGPTATSTCRCFSGVQGEAGKAQPEEYKVERCPLARRIGAAWVGKEHTCFQVKQDTNGAELFGKLATNRAKNCKNDYCGMLQTMACFCQAKEPTADSLRSLHSFGFYQKKDVAETAKELTFLSTPLKPNWAFIQSAKRQRKEIGATNADLENIKKNLPRLISECIVANELPDYIIELYLCRSFLMENTISAKPGDRRKYEINENKMRAARREVYKCAAEKGIALIPRDPETGKAVRVPPMTEVMEMLASSLTLDTICPAKAGVIRAAEAAVDFIVAVARLKAKVQCFALAMRRNAPLHLMASDKAKWGVFEVTGFFPGLPGILLALVCNEMTATVGAMDLCTDFAMFFGLGGIITGAVSVGAACALDASVGAAIKAGQTAVGFVKELSCPAN